MNLIALAERGRIPDRLIRIGIRRLLSTRLRDSHCADPERRGEAQAELRDVLRNSPLAVDTSAANEQHYEVPAEFFQAVLGPRLKYSCCYYPRGDESLAEAEEAMLQLTCDRAELADGMRILELGCGWGSLTLWMAQQYPASRITAVSNSSGQRAHIESRCRVLDLDNVEVITADMRDFDTDQRHDRIVSVEMFEHMRNYEVLLGRIARWLNPGGKLFVHIFSHRESAYLFQSRGESDWMGRHFFTGGIMPSDHLLLYFQDHLAIEQHWRVSGLHYWRTCEDWLRGQDAARGRVLDLLRAELDDKAARVSFQRWRMFFMACAELFRFRGGNEWFVSHYRFRKRADA
jgi:cyclopropane-fatty-acyl-phospholipid synthase